MTLEERFINSVLSRIPSGGRRTQIEMDLRGHLAERLEHGQSMADAIGQFGDPGRLAESYLAAVPLVSASFLSRAAAKVIDMLAIAATAGAVMWLAWQPLSGDDASLMGWFRVLEGPFLPILFFVLLVGLIPGYFVIDEYLTGQTLGKRVLGLRVVKESGARISLGQSFVRQLPLMAGIFLLDVVFALFTENSQRAFELISKSRVVRAEDRPA